MGKVKILLLLLLVLLSAPMEAHRDLLERPIRYSFTLTNGEVLNFEDAEDPQFLAFEQAYLLEKLTLQQAVVVFPGDRVLLIGFSAGACREMSFSNGKVMMQVPAELVGRMHHLHFTTLVRLSSSKREAAAGKDFYLRFSLGQERRYGKYPYLQLHFKKSKFHEAVIWRQTTEFSKQRSAF